MTTPPGPQPSTPHTPRPKGRTPINHPAHTPGECRASGYVDPDGSVPGPAIPGHDANVPAALPVDLFEQAGAVAVLLILAARGGFDCGMSPGWK
jgi:hypothetical protein